MTDLPYTDADLRAEAAAQHAGLTEDPDFMGVGEGMQDSIVASTEANDGGKTWDELLPYEADGGEAYNAAQRKIHDLIPGADISEWAVNLGADGLQPGGHLDLDAPCGRVRLHIAWEPNAPAAERDQVMADLINAIAPVVPLH